MNSEDEEALKSAERAAASEIGRVESEAIQKTARDIAAKKSVNVGAMWGEIVQAKVTAIEEAVDRLIEAHLQTGEKDATVITTSIKTFVEAQHCPGFPGHQGEPRYLRTIATTRSRFDVGRGSAAARVVDKVRLALLAKRSETTRLREITRWMENHVLSAWIIALVAGLAALRGILAFTMTELPQILSLFSRKTL